MIQNYVADKAHTNDAKFRKFRRQLFHSSLSKILETLKPGMTTPEVLRCFDGHFRRVIYSLGPYIADYPEQALLACIVQGWCARYVVMTLLATANLIGPVDVPPKTLLLLVAGVPVSIRKHSCVNLNWVFYGTNTGLWEIS